MQVCQPLPAGHAGDIVHGRNVAAGTEGAAAAGQHQGADGIIGHGVFHGGDQRRPQIQRQGVALCRVVQADDAQLRLGRFGQNRGLRILHERSSALVFLDGFSRLTTLHQG